MARLYKDWIVLFDAKQRYKDVLHVTARNTFAHRLPTGEIEFHFLEIPFAKLNDEDVLTILDLSGYNNVDFEMLSQRLTLVTSMRWMFYSGALYVENETLSRNQPYGGYYSNMDYERIKLVSNLVEPDVCTQWSCFTGMEIDIRERVVINYPDSKADAVEVEEFDHWRGVKVATKLAMFLLTTVIDQQTGTYHSDEIHVSTNVPPNSRTTHISSIKVEVLGKQRDKGSYGFSGWSWSQRRYLYPEYMSTTRVIAFLRVMKRAISEGGCLEYDWVAYQLTNQNQGDN